MSCFIVTLHAPVYCVINNASTKFQNAQCARAAVNLRGYFLICCSILKESCFYCNYPEKIQQAYRQTVNPRLDFFEQIHVLLVTDKPNALKRDSTYTIGMLF